MIKVIKNIIAFLRILIPSFYLISRTYTRSFRFHLRAEWDRFRTFDWDQFADNSELYIRLFS